MKKAVLKKPIKRPAKKAALPAKPKPASLNAEAQADLKSATNSGRWMSAVFWIESEGDAHTVNLKRVTNNFPIAEFELAIQLLTSNLKEIQ